MLRLFRRNRDEEKKATEQAVKPSRERWFGRIANLLRSSRIDDSVWDEIEEILISSDVGVETSLRIIDRLKQQVDLAVKFGCDCMGLWSAGRPPDGASEDEVIERLAGVVRPVCEYAVERGIVLAIEGEPPLIINSVERYHKLFAAVGMDEFKVIFDPSHFDVLGGAVGRPQDLLLDLGVDRVGYIQFCDGDSTLRPFPNGGAGTSKHLPCGEGVYDIPGLCSILYEGGFQGWFQMDSWGTEDAYWTSKSCKDSVLDYLRAAVTGT